MQDFRVFEIPMPIEDYLSPEKFKQYQQFEAGEEILPYSDENAKEISNLKEYEAPNKAKKDFTELYLRSVPEKVQDKMQLKYDKDYKSVKEAEEGLNWEYEQINKQIQDFGKAYENYEIQVKPTLDRLTSIESSISKLTDGTMKIDPTADQSQIDIYNDLVSEYQGLYQTYKDNEFDIFVKDINKQQELVNFNIKELEDKSKNLNDRKIIENALALDYSFTARAGRALEEFFVGGAVNLGSLAAQTVLTGAKYAQSPLYAPSFDQAIYNIKESTQNYNARLAEKREVKIPEALELEDIGKPGVNMFDWFNEAFAENSPSILTTFVPGGLALTGQRQFALAGMRTAQGVFFTAETGGKYGEMELQEKNAKEQIALLQGKFDATEDLNKKAEIQEDIDELERISNYSFAQKAFTSFAFGGTATLAETFGSLKFVTGTSKLASDFGKRQFKKEFYDKGFDFAKNTVGKTLSGLPRLAGKATGINLVEESLTLAGQNGFDIIVLDENKSMLDGLDKDFIANTTVTSFGMFAPRAGGNIVNILKNEFRVKNEVDDVQKKVIELVNLRESMPSLKGGQLKEARKRKSEIIEQLALDDALSYQKLNALTEDQILEAADLSRQMREVSKRARALGSIGDLSESGKQSRKDLEDQYVALNNRRTDLLNTQKLKNIQVGKQISEELGGEFVNTNPSYYLGLYDFYSDAARVMLPADGEYIVVDDLNNLNDFKVLKQVIMR